MPSRWRCFPEKKHNKNAFHLPDSGNLHVFVCPWFTILNRTGPGYWHSAATLNFLRGYAASGDHVLRSITVGNSAWSKASAQGQIIRWKSHHVSLGKNFHEFSIFKRDLNILNGMVLPIFAGFRFEVRWEMLREFKNSHCDLLWSNMDRERKGVGWCFWSCKLAADWRSALQEGHLVSIQYITIHYNTLQYITILHLCICVKCPHAFTKRLPFNLLRDLHGSQRLPVVPDFNGDDPQGHAISSWHLSCHGNYHLFLEAKLLVHISFCLNIFLFRNIFRPI